MTLQLRLMSLDDLQQVSDIEKQAFVTPWSPRTYAYEISESGSSHMVVLSGPSTEADQPSRLRRLMSAIGSSRAQPSTVLAYGGLWNLSDEGHISTIASHPDYRRSGYGEAALAGMMMRAIVLGTSYVALEVRVSNVNAQMLYTKYGFTVYSIKPRYYLDNMEDAYDMRAELTPAIRADTRLRFKAIQDRLGFTDSYTTAMHNLY